MRVVRIEFSVPSSAARRSEYLTLLTILRLTVMISVNKKRNQKKNGILVLKTVVYVLLQSQRLALIAGLDAFETWCLYDLDCSFFLQIMRGCVENMMVKV